MKKIEIIPAILEKNFKKVEKKINEVERLVKIVQVDICDGKFVPSKTIISAGCHKSFLKLKKLSEKKVKLEIDMMVDLDVKISGRFDKWLEGLEILEPKRIIFHINSTKKWDEIFEFLRKSKKLKKTEIGLAAQIQHKCQKDIISLLDKYPFKFVQFMGIEKIGYGGQELTQKVFRKIKKLRKLNEKIPISVDGGVKIFNGKKLKESGVTRLVSGSGLYGAENLKGIIKEFKNL